MYAVLECIYVYFYVKLQLYYYYIALYCMY